MSKTIRWSLAILIFLGLVYWVEKDIGWIQVLKAWQQVPTSTLIGLTLLTLLSYGLRAWRVFIIFGQQAGHPFPQYLRISLLHNALNNFLPMRLGEASFPLLMRHHFQQSLLSSTAALLWIRLMDLHWLLVLLAAILFFHSPLLAGLLLLGLAISPWLLPKFFAFAHGLLSGNKQAKIDSLKDSLPAIKPLSLRLYGLTMLIWSVKLLALALIMLAFIELPFYQALFAVISADLSSVLPIHGLAGSGTYEAAMLAATLPFGIDKDQVLIAAVNVHIYLLLVTLFSVIPALLIKTQRTSPNT